MTTERVTLELPRLEIPNHGKVFTTLPRTHLNAILVADTDTG